MGKSRSRRRKQRKRRSKHEPVSLPSRSEQAAMMTSDLGLESSPPPGIVAYEQFVEAAETTATAAPCNRQARRKAQRQQTKAKKQRGALVDADGTIRACVSSDLHDMPPYGGHPTGPHQVEREKALLFGGGRAGAAAQDDYLIQTSAAADDPPDTQVQALTHQPLPGDQPELDLGGLGEILSAAAKQEAAQIAQPDQTAMQQSASAQAQPEQRFTILPRHRSLTDPNARMLTKLRSWLMRKLAATVARTTPAAPRDSIEHLHSLQSDLAAIQRRIDRMIAGAGKQFKN